MAKADSHHDDHGHDRDHASRKTHRSSPLEEDAAWNNFCIGLKSHFENNTEFNLMTKDGILIVQGYRNQKRKIRQLEQENEWLNEQLGKSEAAAAIKKLEDCLEKAKAGSQRRDADLEAKQRHIEALSKENELLRAKLETLGEAAKKSRRTRRRLHLYVVADRRQ